MAKGQVSTDRKITVDINEFRRTRDALTTAWIALSSSIDRAVKAYIEHTDMVIAGDATLNVSHLLKPFEAIANVANAIQAAAPLPPVVADAEGPPTKKKRAYKPRDPNAPKRPLTAYFRYLGEMRPQILAELSKTDGNHKPGDISLLATERWKGMTPEEHEPYHQAYRADMVAYKQKLADYIASTGGDPTVVAEVESDEEPVAPAKINVDDTSSSTSDTDSDDEPAPPPPPPVAKSKKSSSPEAVVKTPRSAKKGKGAAPTFSSINSAAVPPPPSTLKKRKSEAEAEPASTTKKARDNASAKKDKKKKRVSEV